MPHHNHDLSPAESHEQQDEPYRDLLTSDQTDMWGIGHKIPRVSLIKCNNLLSHHVLPFQMKNSITIRSWSRKSSGYESRQRVIVRGQTNVVTTSNKLL
jgi:hypothetical protein